MVNNFILDSDDDKYDDDDVVVDCETGDDSEMVLIILMVFKIMTRMKIDEDVDVNNLIATNSPILALTMMMIVMIIL